MAKGFTTLSVKSLPDGKHADPATPGLYLWVRGNSRTWQCRATANGKAHYVSIGPVSVYGLAEAREKAIDIRRAIKRGEDPKKAPKVIAKPSTFKEDAETYHSHAKGEWSKLHTRYWWQAMERHVFPALGDKARHLRVVVVCEVLKRS